MNALSSVPVSTPAQRSWRHGPVLGQDHREPRPGVEACLDHGAGAVGRITTHQQSPGAPAARAVVIASVTMLVAPLPEPALLARSQIPASASAAIGVLVVVVSGERPLPRTCLLAPYPAYAGMPAPATTSPAASPKARPAGQEHFLPSRHASPQDRGEYSGLVVEPTCCAWPH